MDDFYSPPCPNAQILPQTAQQVALVVATVQPQRGRFLPCLRRAEPFRPLRVAFLVPRPFVENEFLAPMSLKDTRLCGLMTNVREIICMSF